MNAIVTRSDVHLRPDPARVIARLFVPGHELLVNTQSRATGVLARILALSETVVTQTLETTRERYSHRHRDFAHVLACHYSQIEHRVPGAESLSDDRRNLIGAWFTHEYSIEGAALFNPSAVLHPDQSGLQPGQCRFIISLRAVGEGHVSAVEFRSGVLGPGKQLHLDAASRFVETGRTSPATHDRDLFGAKLAEHGADPESASYIVRDLPKQFDETELDHVLSGLAGQSVTRHGGRHADDLARKIAQCSYEVAFPLVTSLSERVLWPQAPSESHGMEDVRIVRFVGPDDAVSYRATYTAYDGAQITPQLITTSDFATFRVSQLAGPAAKNKGMALFPRMIDGRYVALSRWDRENSAVAWSDDGKYWKDPQTLHKPVQPWELIQTGNCGPPIETDAGWLVLTHGVGPMREYALGALLLDLDDPVRVIGEMDTPLLQARDDEREGYVPNVLYSCGALLHEDTLLLPYGASDATVRFAFVDVPALLERLTAGRSPAATRANTSV